jgi:hypothetical protein
MPKAPVVSAASEIPFMQSIGVFITEVRDGKSDIRIGYEAGSDPLVVAARAVHNEREIKSLSAKLLADLK